MQRNKPTAEDQIIQSLNEQKQSTTTILSILDDTKKIAYGTVDELDRQGAQIGAAQDDMDEILAREQIAKQQLRKVSSFLWEIFYKIFPCIKLQNHNAEINEELAKQNPHMPGKKKPGKKQTVTDPVLAGLKGKPGEKTYKETEQQLDKIEDDVEELRDIADHMGDQIKEHNIRLDVLSKTNEEALIAQEQNNTDIRSMLKSFT